MIRTLILWLALAVWLDKPVVSRDDLVEYRALLKRVRFDAHENDGFVARKMHAWIAKELDAVERTLAAGFTVCKRS